MICEIMLEELEGASLTRFRAEFTIQGWEGGGVGRLSRIDRAGGPDRGKVLTLVSARSYRSYLSTNLGFGINRWN